MGKTQTWRRVQVKRNELRATNASDPTNSELAAATGLSEARIAVMERATSWVTSLDTSVTESGEGDLVDLVSYQSEEEPSHRTANQHEALERAFSKLSPREQSVMTRLFGMQGQDAVTTTELSVELGVSRQRVAQIERAALAKMRKAMTVGPEGELWRGEAVWPPRPTRR
jgi:RNA polymerase sigma factor (sigma-70 family)